MTAVHAKKAKMPTTTSVRVLAGLFRVTHFSDSRLMTTFYRRQRELMALKFDPGV
jgi:hypothetical protein